MKSQRVSRLKELKQQITPPEDGVCRRKQNKNFDEPLPDEGTGLYDGDGDHLDEEVVESNGPDEDSNLDDPEEQSDQQATETRNHYLQYLKIWSLTVEFLDLLENSFKTLMIWNVVVIAILWYPILLKLKDS